MTKIVMKTILLVILVILSIYQTALLWFDYPSDRNFFYSFIDEENVVASSDEIINYDFFQPEKIAVYLGSAESSYRLKTQTRSDDVELTNDNIRQILSALSTGTAIEEPITMDQLWSKQHILYIMPFSISKALLEMNIGSVGDWVPEDFKIDRIYIFPSQSIDDLMFVFTDKSLQNRIGCTLPYEDEKLVNSSLLRYMTTTVNEDGINYISTKQNKIDAFTNDQLLPSNGQSLDLLINLYSDRYFYNGNTRDDAAIEEYSNYFFDFPENKWTIQSENDVRFGDLYAIISYSSKGVFEYNLIEDINGKKTTLNNSYTEAKNFMSRDSILGQVEFYLDKYTENEFGYTFYFNYMYRGIPLLFDNINENYGMSYPMEVTVIGNTVTSYRRLLWKNQDLLMQGNPIEVKLQKPIDELLVSRPEANGSLEGMYLAYHIKDLQDGANLNWVIEYDNVRYLSELE